MSLYIRTRDRACVLCGKTDIQNGHLITRGCFSTRWEEINCHAQCKGCNMYHEFNPHRYINWFITKYGLKTYQDLVIKSNQLRKFTQQDLQDIKEYYDNKLKELLNSRS
jgi:hypothetical protein